MLRHLKDCLSEAVMGFLALAALALGLAPLLFDFPAAVEEVFDAIQWAIVALFTAEYATNLAASHDRTAFVRNPWRVLDLAIIVVSFASILPFVPESARTVPALRILRLFRALLFGMRAGYTAVRPASPPPRGEPLGPVQVERMNAADAEPRTGDWQGLLQWAAAPTSEWVHVSSLPPERLLELSTAAGMPHVAFEAALHDTSYPRLQPGARWSALSLSFPSREDLVRRDPVLLLVTENALLSIGRHPMALAKAPRSFEELPWGPRCALDVVRRVLGRNEELAGSLEREVRRLESLPAAESPESFFHATFRLKRALSMARGDLWRLRGLLELLADGKRDLPGLREKSREDIRRLAEEADFHYETVDNTRETILSLIDLHINVAAHETNRFMRLVAIMSTLALIPAIAGGLLGMNLGDAPWPVTLGQVGFITLMLMLGVLYTFLAKGWLR